TVSKNKKPQERLKAKINCACSLTPVAIFFVTFARSSRTLRLKTLESRDSTLPSRPLPELYPAHSPAGSPAAHKPPHPPPISASTDDTHPQYSTPPKPPAAPCQSCSSARPPRASLHRHTRQASECIPDPILAGYTPDRKFPPARSCYSHPSPDFVAL